MDEAASTTSDGYYYGLLNSNFQPLQEQDTASSSYPTSLLLQILSAAALFQQTITA